MNPHHQAAKGSGKNRPSSGYRLWHLVGEADAIVGKMMIDLICSEHDDIRSESNLSKPEQRNE